MPKMTVRRTVILPKKALKMAKWPISAIFAIFRSFLAFLGIFRLKTAVFTLFSKNQV